MAVDLKNIQERRSDFKQSPNSVNSTVPFRSHEKFSGAIALDITGGLMAAGAEQVVKRHMRPCLLQRQKELLIH